MKEFSVKKLVFCCIGLLSAIMLLVGLSFSVLSYDLGLEEIAGDVMDATGFSANGFDMLSFEFPVVLRAMIATFMSLDDVTLFETFLGITSLLSLICAITSTILIVLAFFLFSSKKAKKAVTWCVIISLSISALHAIISIISAISIHGSLMDFYELLEEGMSMTTEHVDGFSTIGYVSLIIQVVFLTAYLICGKVLKEKISLKKSVAEDLTAKNVNKTKVFDKDDELKKIVEGEKGVVALLAQYKTLYEENVISAGDLMDKKAKVLQYSDKSAKEILSKLVKESSYLEVVQAESLVMDILKEYNKLLKNGTLSDADYVQKKASLLGYVI